MKKKHMIALIRLANPWFGPDALTGQSKKRLRRQLKHEIECLRENVFNRVTDAAINAILAEDEKVAFPVPRTAEQVYAALVSPVRELDEE